MTESGPSNEFKMVVLGGGGVGKSALTIRLVTDNFLAEYDPTIEDNYHKNATVENKPCVLDILDTAGQDEYSQMQDQWMREGKGFLIVYAIDNYASFNEVQTFKDKISRVKETDRVPIVLVGNKCDMEGERQVSFDQGQTLAQDWGCPFFEASAKAKINNEECFYEVVREIIKIEEEKEKEKGGSSSSGRKRCFIL
jgi:GTPase KRas protein